MPRSSLSDCQRDFLEGGVGVGIRRESFGQQRLSLPAAAAQRMNKSLLGIEFFRQPAQTLLQFVNVRLLDPSAILCLWRTPFLVGLAYQWPYQLSSKIWQMIKGNIYLCDSPFTLVGLCTEMGKRKRMKSELEMRGGSWQDHREPFRQNFAAVCRSTQKLLPRGRTIFGRFLHLEIWAGCRILLSGSEPSLPPF